jgi:hypothetical protein
MGTEITTQGQPQTVQQWQADQRLQKSQIEALDGRLAARRGAELVAMLEAASVKIDRFGWDKMDDHLKQTICDEWCDLLCQYRLDEVRDGIRAVFEANGGRMKSINEFQVQEQIRIAHRKRVAAMPRDLSPEPERKPVDMEAAARIIAESGLQLKRFGA